jgi:hypothetical protein
MQLLIQNPTIVTLTSAKTLGMFWLNMQDKQTVKLQENSVSLKANIWSWKQELECMPIPHENWCLYR